MVPSLIEILRRTLRQVEEQAQIAQDDPALTEIKSNLVLAIAELEVSKDYESESQLAVTLVI